MKEREEKTEWDKKKILLFAAAVLLLIGIGYVFKGMMLGSQEMPNTSKIETDVKGTSVQASQVGADIKENIQNQINNLKDEAQNVNIVDIATSSPQVQKVINDLKAIQDYPKSQLKATCEKICSGL
jgi:conjugal transfer/entry exclusion protein